MGNSIRVLRATYQLRKDTLSNWETQNPILLDGERVLVIDGVYLRTKTGDGESLFSQLQFDDSLLPSQPQPEPETTKIVIEETEVNFYIDAQTGLQVGELGTHFIYLGNDVNFSDEGILEQVGGATVVLRLSDPTLYVESFNIKHYNEGEENYTFNYSAQEASDWKATQVEGLPILYLNLSSGMVMDEDPVNWRANIGMTLDKTIPITMVKGLQAQLDEIRQLIVEANNTPEGI